MYRAAIRTRMPFRYGIATMTELPHVFVRATVEIDGAIRDGTASDNLPPKWFTKEPERDPGSEIEDMFQVIQHAMTAAGDIVAPCVFTFWQELFHRQADWAAARKIPSLLAQFGTSLVERAVIDAFARCRKVPFHRLLEGHELGIDLGAFHPELAGSKPSDWLPPSPLTRVIVRHTIGLSDPLTEADIASESRLDDALPQSLEACIRTYGLRHFKIKINGRCGEDLARIEHIAAVLEKNASAGYAFSLDGNESFSSFEALRDFWAEMNDRPGLRAFVRRLLFVEQPLHRDVALEDAGGSSGLSWCGRPPIIIDESDGGIDSLRLALERGYAGVSHKNCKGVFKGIANACRIAQLRRMHPDGHFLMSGEDLANIGPIALLQDLAVQAMLGNETVERNGHHYFAGLSIWPEQVQRTTLSGHPDLYRRGIRSWPTLDIRDGYISVRSVVAAPFGVLHDVPLESLDCEPVVIS